LGRFRNKLKEKARKKRAKKSANESSAPRDSGQRGLKPSGHLRSLWQNGVAERWVGSCRRDLLDHIIPVNERHLKRLLSEYIRYHHLDRTHLGLKKDRPPWPTMHEPNS